VVVAALVALGTALASCSGSRFGRDDAPDAGRPWAHEAEDLFGGVARELSDSDQYAATAQFGEHGVLDLQAWGGDVYSGRLEIAEELGTWLGTSFRTAHSPSDLSPLDVDVDQIFLGAREAIVRFDAHLLAAGVPWIQIYAVGENSLVSSRLYTEDLGLLDPAMRWTDAPRHPFYEQYVDVWSSGDPRRLAEVYAGEVVVRDAFDGEQWTGLDELAGEMGDAAPIERGPWPELFRYDVGNRHEQIAVFQFAGPCPSLEARRWVFDDGLITDETRYPHLGSVRRCEGSAGAGWWSGYEVDPGQRLTVETTTIGRQPVDLVNAGPEQADLVHWLFERYERASLAQPDVAAVWFPPSVDCSLSEGIAKRTDDRFGGRQSITLCFTSDEVSADWPNRRWSDHVAHQGLHELAQMWMYDHLDAIDRLVFVRRAGLDGWRDTDVLWPRRGVEVAAETIAWGLAGDTMAEYLIEPSPGCRELTARYVLLTGEDPLTTCDVEGGR
jgi:hypothetical protein